jgi:DNA primase
LPATDLRTFLEDLKERAPIEELVRVRLGEDLRRQGSLWVACCPFHAEKTPSFKVDPRRQRWHCYGACGEGGDAISFVERFDNVEFREAVETVAHFAGVAVPDSLWRRRDPGEDKQLERLRQVLERATELYQRHLLGREGTRARAYLERRGLTRETWEAFGLGWAPDHGNPVIELARREGWPFELVSEAGLARRGDTGNPYDFFRGRLVIPIRDLRSRVVGFGARLVDEREGPKYVNTAETALFHKGRLVYALDRALPEVRRGHHLVLVEGYTDVMGAHQVGLGNVAAVLGTATTDDHAALVRRSGARRVTLVFDGDQAGRSAALKALLGLLPLGLTLDVAVLPQGQDPCDLCVARGSEGLAEHIAAARDWFAFLLEGTAGLSGGALAAAVDPLLDCIRRLSSSVERDLRIADLAAHLGIREEALRQRLSELPGASARERPAGAPRRSAPEPSDEGRVPGVPEGARPGQGGAAPAEPSPTTRREERLLREAYAQIAGACLLDNSLIPALSVRFDGCPEPELGAVLTAIARLYADTEDLSPVDGGRVLCALEDHPARRLVGTLEEQARCADSPQAQAEGAVRFLEEYASTQALRERSRALREADDWSAELEALRSIDQELRLRTAPKRKPEHALPPASTAPPAHTDANS